MERDSIRIPVPCLRLRSGSKDLHENDEGPYSSPTKVRNSSSDLPRRSIDLGVLTGASDESQGHSAIPVPSPRPDYQHEKISAIPLPGTRISGSHNQQHNNDVLPFTRKDSKIDFNVSRGMQNTHNDTKKSVFPDRKTLVNSGSCDSSPFTTQIPTTVLHKSTGSKTALRDNDNAFFRRYFGTEVVGGKPKSGTGKPYSFTITRANHLLGRSKDRGLGSSMSPRINGGTLVGTRARPPYQRPGAPSSRTSDQNLHQISQAQVSSHEDRQHYGPFLPGKNGRDQEPSHDRDRQKNLGIPSATWDHNYYRMDSISSKRDSGLGIQECNRFRRMETVPSRVSVNLSSDGPARDRPVCIQDISPTTTILQLESRPKMPCGGCILPGLDTRVPLCLPPILPDNKGTEENDDSICRENDPYHTPMANTTMVSSGHGQIDRDTDPSTVILQPAEKSLRRESSSTSKLLAKAGGLAGVRDRLKDAGVSEGASSLILNSRREGTSKSYESAWKRWSLWCSRRDVDPFTCPVNNILDYITHLFDSGTPARTISNHRSAISAYHKPVVVDGTNTSVKTGRHPLVSALMGGVNNMRPPQCRYSFTWDIETVLCLFKSWPEPLTSKQLTIKVTTLLALIGVPRGAELHQFNLNFMADHGDKYVFQLVGTVKNVKSGVKPQPLEYHIHKEDRKLCPISCINQYIALTEPWRSRGEPSSLFLSFQKQHKPVCKATLARWIKEALHLADVDTKVFQAHSLRGASTSKALLKGLSVKEVVDHGKWSLESTWQKFYHKTVESKAKKFQDSILKL